MTNTLNWLQGHVWLCTYIIAGLAIITFLLNFIFKPGKKEETSKEVKKVKMKNSHIRSSTINQSAGDMVVNINSDGTKN